jgi:AbrB family looped-hinge helix DNA binding protein
MVRGESHRATYRMHHFQSSRIYETGSRGRVTIPAELRKQLEIKPGTRVAWFEEKGRLILAPMTTRRVKDIRGFLKPKPGESSAFEELFKERARERRREDLKAAQGDQQESGQSREDHAALSQNS